MAFKLDEAYVEITARMETLATNLDDARKSFQKWTAATQKGLANGLNDFAKWEKGIGKSFQNAGRTLEKFSLGFKSLIAGAAVGQLVKSTTDWADKLGDISAKTGFSAEALSVLDYQLAQTDGSIDEFTPAIRGMAKFLEQAGDDAVKSADKMASARTKADLKQQKAEIDAAEQSWEKYGNATDRVVNFIADVRVGIEKNNAAFEKWESIAAKSSKAIKPFSRNLSDSEKALTKLGLSIEDFAGKSQEEAFEKLAEAIEGVEDPIDKAALSMKVFGVSSLAELDVKAKQVSDTIGEIGDDAGESQSVLAKLGLTLDSFKGLAPEQTFQKFADALRNVKDPMEKIAIAQEVFGKSAQGLMPYLETSKGTLDMLAAAARQYGVELNGLEVARLSQLHDSIVRVKNAFFGLAKDLMTQAAPVLDRFATYLTETLIPKMREMLAGFNVGKFLEDTGAKVERFLKVAGETFEKLSGHFTALVDKLREMGILTDGNATSVAAFAIEAGLVSTVGGPLLVFIGDVILASAGFTKAIAMMIGAASKGGVAGFSAKCGAVVAAGGGGYLLGQWIYDMADKKVPALRDAFDAFGASVYWVWEKIGNGFALAWDYVAQTGTVLDKLLIWPGEWYSAIFDAINRIVGIFNRFMGFLQTVWDRLMQIIVAARNINNANVVPGITPSGYPVMRGAAHQGGGGAQANVSMGGVTVNVAGTAGEAPETFAKRVARAVVDAQRMNLKSSGALLALP